MTNDTKRQRKATHIVTRIKTEMNQEPKHDLGYQGYKKPQVFNSVTEFNKYYEDLVKKGIIENIEDDE